MLLNLSMSTWTGYDLTLLIGPSAVLSVHILPDAHVLAAEENTYLVFWAA